MEQIYLKTDNGLMINFIKLPDVKTVTMGLSIKVGGANENEKEMGIAHYLEHMLFNNTQNRTETQIMDEMDTIGASYNAYTNFDYTSYYVKGKSTNSLKLIDILFDIFFKADLKDDFMQRERMIILQELRSRDMHPSTLNYKSAMTKIFSDRRMHPLIGTEESINNLKLVDLQNFYKNKYNINKTCLVVSGNFDDTKLINYIKEYFNTNIKEINPNFPDYMEQLTLHKFKQNIKNIEYIKSDVEQTIVTMHFPGCEFSSMWKFFYNILSLILTGISGALLTNQLRTKLGATYNVSSGLVEMKDTGYFTIYYNVNNDNLLQSIEMIFDILKDLKENVIDENLLNKAREYIETNLLFTFEDLNVYYDLAIESYIYNIKSLTSELIKENIDKVNQKNLLKLSQGLFNKDTMIITFQGKINVENDIEILLNKL